MHQPPPQQGYGAQPQQGYAGVPQQGYAGAPQQGFAGPPPQQGFAGPPPQQGFNGAPPQQGFAGGAPSQQGFAGAPPQHGYAGAPQQGFAAAPTQGNGIPMQQDTTPQTAPPQAYPPGSEPPGVVQQAPPQPAAGQAWKPGATGEGAAPYKWDNTPDSDPEDNENASEDVGTGPDVKGLQTVPGYENVVFDDGQPVPPPVYEPPSEQERPQETFQSAENISEDAVRAAMLAFVDKKCCYGSRPAKQMAIKNIITSNALHYILETFTESRTTSRKFKPHRGGLVDGFENGMPPTPWQMLSEPNELFKTHKKHQEVPHTSFLKGCHRCNSCGFVRCARCSGRGTVRCGRCHGSGSVTVHRNGESHRQSCGSCGGRGRRRCIRCGGDGRVTCPVCEGFCTLRHYILMTASYVNNVSDYILEGTDMPDELIRDVSGKVIFEQALPWVWPISQFPVQEINTNSIRIVDSHRTAWPQARTLKQRQTLRSVPVTEAHYTWKDVSTRFWVYGFEHEVHAPDYPHQCCWGCSVL
ncbi:protein SSUH2 homolog [Asterias rubens]|uniref:protein SSUH2 homolog n=1 Tax=Asterias rubens TaxID=7604 RepID=UPI0014552B89|nr:protein SSUH2 homolog [Asterias rubens]